MEEKIIDFVRHNRLLYDRKKKYNNQQEKDEKWAELANDINVSADYLKKRWKTIKDRYYRIIKDEKCGRSSSKKYKYFDQLEFLTRSESYRKRVSEYSSERENIKDEVLEETHDVFMPEMDMNSLYKWDPIATPSSPQHEGQEVKRRKTREDQDIQNETKYSTKSVQRSTPIKLFMESVALQIESANLGISSIMSLQVKILKAVEEEILRHNEENDNKINGYL